MLILGMQGRGDACPANQTCAHAAAASPAMQASAECASSQAVMAAERGGEAASLVGRRVLKKFTGYGTHTGTVVAQLPADSDERTKPDAQRSLLPGPLRGW